MNMVRETIALLAIAMVSYAADARAQMCTPDAKTLRATAAQARATMRNDDAFIKALDLSVRGDKKLNPDPIAIEVSEEIGIFAMTPYNVYRSALREALRKMDPIESVEVPDAVQIAVVPQRIGAPDIVKIVVQRDGQLVTPIANHLTPTPMKTRMGAEFTVHAGIVTFPCSAFRPGATVTITAVPDSGSNFTKTLKSADLETYR